MSQQRSEKPASRRLLSRSVTAFLVASALVLLNACGGSDGGGRSGGDTAVTLKGITFRPEAIAVAAGTTVTWSNEDTTSHTVTSGTVDQGAAGVTERPDGLFDSGQFATGRKFSFTFDRPGTYSYFCALHPATMRGQISVR